MYPTIKMLAPPRRRAGRSRARGLGRSGEMAAARAQGAGPRERRRLNEREGRVTRQEVHPEGDSPQTFCRPGRWQPALPVWTSRAPVLPGAGARPPRAPGSLLFSRLLSRRPSLLTRLSPSTVIHTEATSPAHNDWPCSAPFGAGTSTWKCTSTSNSK